MPMPAIKAHGCAPGSQPRRSAQPWPTMRSAALLHVAVAICFSAGLAACFCAGLSVAQPGNSIPSGVAPAVIGGRAGTASWPASGVPQQRQQRPHGSAVARRVVMEPPTLQAPPEVNDDVGNRRSDWVECAIEECSGEECQRFENWVFRKEHVEDYRAFLGVRNLEPAGVLPGRHQYGAGSNGLTTRVTCRKRGVDASLSCRQCIRLVKGGPYGARGVAVAAYPQQDQVMGCLSLSALLPKSRPRAGERWDGNQETPRQTAFCNTINVAL